MMKRDYLGGIMFEQGNGRLEAQGCWLGGRQTLS